MQPTKRTTGRKPRSDRGQGNESCRSGCTGARKTRTFRHFPRPSAYGRKSGSSRLAVPPDRSRSCIAFSWTRRNGCRRTVFLHALNFCMLLPGPEAMQLATYAGWMMHGVRGGLAAGLMFVLPGACVVFALAMLYATLGQVPLVEAVFLGVKAAVLVIVVQALLKIASRALKRTEHWAIAAAAFVAIFFLSIPYPLIVLAAAIVGWVFLADQARQPERELVEVPVSSSQTAVTLATWLAIWLLPLVGSRSDARSGPRSLAIRLFLLQTCNRDLRRRIRGSRLHGAGGGRGLSLAHRRRNARRSGAGRNNSGPSHPRDGIRRCAGSCT